MKQRIIKRLEELETIWGHYGWTTNPMSKKKAISLIIRGFTNDQIYDIGCDFHSFNQYV